MKSHAEAGNLLSLLRYFSGSQPERDAFIFLDANTEPQARYSYRMLDAEAQRIAANLQQKIRPGDRVLLLFPPGVEFVGAFFGCLYAGAVAVPTYPPLSQADLPRLEGVIKSAAPAVVISTGALINFLKPICDSSALLSAIPWLAMEDFESRNDWVEHAVNDDTLALLQYTSGSTGAPRGVMVTHGQLLQNEIMIKEAFGHSEKTVLAGWLPLYHDMGLIGNVLQSLYLGITCYLLSPLDFLQRPMVWLRAVSRYRATTSAGPSFAYGLCVRKLRPEQCAELDLSSWDVACNAAEPIRADVMDAFAAAFAPYGFRREAFYPCYGLAEATLFATGSPKTQAPQSIRVEREALSAGRAAVSESAAARTLVSCGRAWGGQELAIVQPETHERCGPGLVGEIWISGQCVALGYWNDPAQTQEVFRAALSDSPGKHFLRTGDLGFVLDGQLYITGRLKDLIIVRGRNHFPEDIERTVEQSCPGLRPGCGVAFAVDVDGDEQVVVAHEVAREHVGELNAAELGGDIREAVAARHRLALHDIVLLPAGALPKTSSGKLRRQATRAQYLSGSMMRLDLTTADPHGAR